MRILIIEDDIAIANVLRRGLVDQRYSVDVANDGRTGCEMGLCNDYDLILLDLMLPELGGRDVCATLRREGVSTPILMLTALSSSEDVVSGLDTGADDYLAKPFDFTILLARVRALTRRHTDQKTARITASNLVIDTAHRTATRNGRVLDLTAKEFALLEYFMMNQRRILSRESIGEHVWNINFDPKSNVIESLVRFLRQKIDEETGDSQIRTIRGLGYRFEPAEYPREPADEVEPDT